MIYFALPNWLVIIIVVVLSIFGCLLLIKDYLTSIIIKHLEKKELLEEWIKKEQNK